MRADAIASIAFGLFTLYTVAAVLSRDRNGRRLALLTADLGIAFQLAELPLKMHIAKQTVAAGGALILEAFDAAGGARGVTQAELIAALNVISGGCGPWSASAGACCCSSIRRPARARALRPAAQP